MHQKINPHPMFFIFIVFANPRPLMFLCLGHFGCLLDPLVFNIYFLTFNLITVIVWFFCQHHCQSLTNGKPIIHTMHLLTHDQLTHLCLDIGDCCSYDRQCLINCTSANSVFNIHCRCHTRFHNACCACGAIIIC